MVSSCKARSELFKQCKFIWSALRKWKPGRGQFHLPPVLPVIYRIYTQTKLFSIYRRNLLYIDKTSCVACNSGETPKALLLSSRSLWTLWRYPANFCYVTRKLLIFNISKIWSGVIWNSREGSRGTQLGHDKRDIPAFHTVRSHNRGRRLYGLDRAPIIWDNFSIFRTNCAIVTSRIPVHPRPFRGYVFSRECCHVAWSNGEGCEILMRTFHSDGRM